MKASQILSRRSERKVDFRPDADQSSPHAQLRRLSSLLSDRFAGEGDIDDEALDWYEEYVYRKVFSGVSHEEYVATPKDVIAWLLAVHEIETENFRNERGVRK